MSLIVGYNGLGRLAKDLFGGASSLHVFGITIDLTIVPAVAPDIGDPTALRLTEPALGSQVSWLLPLAVFGLLAAAIQIRARLPLTRQAQSLVLWGGWLLTAGVFFSVSRFFHLYYLAMLGPAIAALAGLGVVALWRLYRQPSSPGQRVRGWTGWLLPLALLVTAALQNPYPERLSQLRTLAHAPDRRRVSPGRPGARGWQAAAERTGGAGADPARHSSGCPGRHGPWPAALAAAPTTWAALSIAGGNGSAWLPQAGPSSSGPLAAAHGASAAARGGFNGGGNFGGNGGSGGFGGGSGGLAVVKSLLRVQAMPALPPIIRAGRAASAVALAAGAAALAAAPGAP